MTYPLIEVLHLSARHADALRQAAISAYPNECCGLVVGEGAARLTISEVVPVPNISDTPRRAFAVDPQKQFEILRAVRGTSQRVIGHYHSHPNGAAVPSQHDLAMAHDPEAIWIVVGAVGIRAFQHPEGRADFIEIPIVTG
jgi:proteasome lid subunit RPN8/RPN11